MFPSPPPGGTRKERALSRFGRRACLRVRSDNIKATLKSEEGEKKSANHGTEESTGSLSPQMCVRFRG